MSWHQEMEDQYTVKCKKCGHEIIDPHKSPRQKYIIGKCPKCGHVHAPGGYIREIKPGGYVVTTRIK